MYDEETLAYLNDGVFLRGDAFIEAITKIDGVG